MKKIIDDGDKGNSEYNLYDRLLKHSLEGRRCGLGFTGLADTIALLGYKYDSEESLKMIKHIMRLMFIAEMDSMIDMAITRGKFPGYDKSLEEKGNLWYDTLKKDMP
jgi:ribonucleoside-diphosphate reductase alpha chain